MPICCSTCKTQPKIPLWCSQCEDILCVACLINHEEHRQKLGFLCQECEEDDSTPNKMVFCESCEQHLCGGCDERIHNKGKRAKHMRVVTSSETLNLKLLYVICADAQTYYGYISPAALLMDLNDSAPQNEPYMILMEKVKELSQLKKLTTAPIKTFSGDNEFDEELVNTILVQYPRLVQIVFVESPATKNYYGLIKDKIDIKLSLFQLAEVVAKKPPQKIGNLSISSVSLPNSSFNNKSNFSNISAKYPHQENRNHLSINISTSTENSLRKRKRKAPIFYYHPYICSKGDKRSEIEDEYRQMASNGTLMIQKEQCKKFEERVLRKFNRNIGETQVQYVSLQIDIQNLSVQCLYWVVRSIQEDHMAPTEKLILSRLKQSYDIKVQSKLWHYIIKYLQSNLYDNDRMENDRMGNIPRLIVHPFNAEDNYILYCKPDDVSPVRWVYEDLSELNQTELSWNQFLGLINNYFQSNTQIGGGRYGCVQYIKFNASKPLRDCSLGKLSMFVQEAINKGIIRYHKTLLVSNRTNEDKQKSQSGQQCQTLPQLQSSIKVNTLQLLLIQSFRESGPGVPISLAQIPQNLKKNALFQINYIDLGFPKLKNLLSTLTELVDIQLNKSHIVYSNRPETSTLLDQKREKVCQQTNLLLSLIIKNLQEIIDASNLSGIAMDQLYNQLAVKTGLNLDCMLFNTPDFYRFLSYYGQNYFNVQINMGYFIVYKKWQGPVKKNPEASTPTFKAPIEIQYHFKNLGNYNWEECALADWESKQGGLPKQEEAQVENQNQSESFSDYKSIYNLIDDMSESQPQTVIVKEGSAKTGNNGLFAEKVIPSQEREDSASNGFEDSISELIDPRGKSKQHNRMYSNTAQQKTQHYRVYSNMSRN